MSSPNPHLDALRIDRPAAGTRRGGCLWPVIILLILAAGGGGVYWWMTRPKPLEVKTAVVKMVTSGGASGNSGGRTLLNASGYVTTRREATVSSKVTGKVTEILIEEGMKVEANQIVARLDASNVETNLRLAEAQLDSARLTLAETEPMRDFTEAELKRLTGLVASNAASKSDLDRALAESKGQIARLARQRSDLIVAERQVEQWKQQMDDMIIRAPFAGIVTTKNSQPGEMISPMSSGGFTRTGICTLVDMASLEIEVDVSESYINRVQAGMPVLATLDAYPEWKIPAKVIAIIPTADRQKATVKVRVGFEKLDPRILPQMGVKVAFQSAPEKDTAGAPSVEKVTLTIPKTAIQKRDGRDIAWVVKEGRVERRAVTVTESGQDELAVSAGLAKGEVVILNPPASISEGTSVSWSAD